MKLKKYLVLPGLFLICGAGSAQDSSPDRHGKTDSQILAMGEEAWDQFYQKVEGFSTPSMIYSNILYGDALFRRNAKILKATNPASRAKVKKLDSLLSDFGGSAVELGRNIDGGGTMFRPLAAHIEVDVQLIVYAMLHPVSSLPKSRHVSDVIKSLNLLDKQINELKGDPDRPLSFRYSDAIKDSSQMRGDYIQIVEVAQTLSRKNSDRTLGFCLYYTGLARNDFE